MSLFVFNSWNLIRVFCILFLLGLAVFFNSFQNKFMMDDYYFRSTPLYSDTHYSSLQWNPYREQSLGIVDKSSNQNIYYRPFAHVEISICYALFKENYWKYHLFNLFMFVMAAFFIYLCIVQLSKNPCLAFLASALYLVHPINGVVVNYIPASCFAFQIIFISGSIFLLFLSIERNNSRFYYYISLLFFILALLCHESSIMTPFYMAAALIVAGHVKTKRILSCLTPFILVLLVFIVFRFVFVQHHEIFADTLQASRFDFFKYIATIFILILWYISKLFFPKGITLMFLVQDIQSYVFWYDFAFFIALFLSILLLIKFKQDKVKLIALLWFLIGFGTCVIATFVVYNQTARIESHWFNFSSIGFFILAAFCLLNLIKFKKLAGYILLSVVFLLLIKSSHAYNNQWRNEETYMKYWLSIYPNNTFAQGSLVHAYMVEKQFDKAEDVKLLMLKDDEKNFDLYHDLAVIAFLKQDFFKAEVYIKKAIELRPTCVECYLKLADISFEKKDFDSSESFLLKAHSLDSSNLEIVYKMIYLYSIKKDSRLRSLSQNFLNRANNSELWVPFAKLMAENGFNDLAYQAYQKALKVNPQDKYVYLGIGAFLGNQGLYEEAIKMCEYGLKIDPNENHFREIIEQATEFKKMVK